MVALANRHELGWVALDSEGDTDKNCGLVK